MNEQIVLESKIWTKYDPSLDAPIKIVRMTESGVGYSTITTVRNSSKKMREAVSDMIGDSSIIAVTMSFAKY